MHIYWMYIYSRFYFHAKEIILVKKYMYKKFSFFTSFFNFLFFFNFYINFKTQLFENLLNFLSPK